MVVYPRWRGEHPRHQLKGEALDGLSPLARGTLTSHLSGLILARFIPAGAGNTGRGILLNSQTPCLSPLARGTLSEERDLILCRRFIPAGAGNTTFDSMREGFTSVYPRWRGEHNVVLERAPRRNGLSPLARGTQVLSTNHCQLTLTFSNT